MGKQLARRKTIKIYIEIFFFYIALRSYFILFLTAEIVATFGREYNYVSCALMHDI